MRPFGVVLVACLLAGCLGGGTDKQPSPTVTPPTIPDLVLDHDHKDAALHDVAVGLDLVAFLDAAPLLQGENARLSDIQFFGNLSVVAVNGRVGASAGGFLLFGLNEEGGMDVLGRYRSGSEDNWYVKFSPDGKHVFLTANGGTSLGAALGAIQAGAAGGAAGTVARGIHVVSVADPTRPVLVGYFPAPVRVINVAPAVAADGQYYLFASMTHDRLGRTAGTGATPSLNYVSILRFDPTNGGLLEVARWQPAAVPGVAEAFPHDLAVAVHPVNGRLLLYAAYWDAGAYIVDVTRPDAPATIARIPAQDAADHVHTFKPHPGLLNGSHIAVLAPETFGAEPAGAYRAFDVTDPRKPVGLGSWTPPPGDVVNAEPLLFSPHEFALDRGRLYASQNHGGAWILSVPDLRPLATWQRSLGNPARTNDWAVNIETTVPYAGRVFAVDMGSGVYVLHESG